MSILITDELLEPLLNEFETAKILKVKVTTLRSWRIKGSPLPFRRIGRAIRYAPSDIVSLIKSGKANSTTEADHAQ